MTETRTSGSIAREIRNIVEEARKPESRWPLLEGAEGGVVLGALATESRTFSAQIDILIGRGDIEVLPSTGWAGYWTQILSIAQMD